MNRKHFLPCVLLLAFATTVSSQDQTNSEWLAKDVQNVRHFLSLLPIERLPFNLLEEEFDRKFIVNGRKVSFLRHPEDFGFGYRQVEIGVPGGYCSIFVRGFLLDYEYVRFKAGVTCSSRSWEKIKDTLITTWKDGKGPEVVETESGFHFERQYDNQLRKYKDRVALKLGNLNERIVVPSNLRDDYEALISPFEHSIVGKDGCGPGGVVPWGKISIDAIAKTKRLDILENILRAYNPGGRVYALLALIDARSRRAKLSPETEKTMKLVADLDSKITVCLGGTLHIKTAAEVVKEFGSKL